MSIRDIINGMLATMDIGEAGSMLSKIGSIRDGRERVSFRIKKTS